MDAISPAPLALRHSRAGKRCSRCGGSMMTTWDDSLGTFLSCLACGAEEGGTVPSDVVHQRALPLQRPCRRKQHDLDMTGQRIPGKCDACVAEQKERTKAKGAAIPRQRRTG
jgi:hypothetical protein